MTNRLRTEATDHLLAAGRAVGVRRFVAQSFGAFRFARTGGPVQTEADPLDPDPPAALRTAQAGFAYLERAVTEIDWAEGLALRYGGFYGPGTSMSADPEAVDGGAVRKRRFPDGRRRRRRLVVHPRRATPRRRPRSRSSTARPASTTSSTTIPRRCASGCPSWPSALGAKPPRRIPRWLGRLVAGEAATIMMTEVRGASNEKAKRELGWEPRYASWRQGFVRGLG